MDRCQVYAGVLGRRYTLAHDVESAAVHPTDARRAAARSERAEHAGRGGSCDEVRRRRCGMTAAMYEYAKKHGGEFSIPEVTQAIESDFPNPAKSSIRSCLQNERYFERIRPGVFRAI